MSAPIIRQLEERHVASKVDLMVWSSKMDLLALSNTKGILTLFLLNHYPFKLANPFKVKFLGKILSVLRLNVFLEKEIGRLKIIIDQCQYLLLFLNYFKS